MTMVKVISDLEGANRVSGCTSGFVNDMASSVPPLATSLKLDMVEENNGAMANNVKEHKTGGGESSIVGESSLALISWFQVGEGVAAAGAESSLGVNRV
jgi:hypothetical protein